MIFYSAFIIISSCFIQHISASCPEELGWILAGDSCYLVSLEAMDWYSAQEVSSLNICVKSDSSDCFSSAGVKDHILLRSSQEKKRNFLISFLFKALLTG